VVVAVADIQLLLLNEVESVTTTSHQTELEMFKEPFEQDAPLISKHSKLASSYSKKKMLGLGYC
jgi:hypothetical protein